MKISLICSQRNKKALLGSLAATGRLFLRQGQSCAAVTHHSWPMSSDDNCRVQHCQCERNGSSHEPTFETSLTSNLGSVFSRCRGGGRGVRGVSPLPCLYSNNGTETFETALNCVAGLVSLLSLTTKTVRKKPT